MVRDSVGVWETTLNGELDGTYYGYKVFRKGEADKASKTICLDPYARAVATFNTYLGQRLGIVMRDKPFTWNGDTCITRNWGDMIIYEMHVRDLTADPSSGAKQPGTYAGLVEPGRKGGIDYITSLGVNTVELLPAQEFATIEVPYKDTLNGWFNTWNPYARNHWGYMTSSFFAPAAYYAEPWKELRWNTWMGKDGRAVDQFKSMVKEFHKRGIAVLMDVVYNHVSDFEKGNLKEIDPQYYFRFDTTGHYLSVSGCGNDFKTERPMARRMIVESILYWMKEYHIDGFRFDLANMIDWETVDAIRLEARTVNPSVVLIAEPWGGGYNPAGFSKHGWGAWNDQIRNGVKGQNPNDGLGWIFGQWQGNNSLARLMSYVNGTLSRDPNGIFADAAHSINYLESHDDNTFGDFIRLGLRDVKPDQRVTDISANARLTPMQLKLNKLGALFLFTSRGATMIGEGQEYARSKVIAPDPKAGDPRASLIDANSYNKDNATNYLNFNLAAANASLVDYYKGLIRLRTTFPSFRNGTVNDVSFMTVRNNPLAIAYTLGGPDGNYLVMMNGSPDRSASLQLPLGVWSVLVDADRAGIRALRTVSGNVEIAPQTGIVLRRN
jgi:pullulanase/glycogen debranching enzyme